MSLGAGNLLLASAGDEGYNLTRSLRLRSSASAYLNRTFASTPSIYTISVWVKRGQLGAFQVIAASRNAAVSSSQLYFNSSDQLYFANDTNSVTTTAVFRDPSAWYHVVLKFTLNGSATIYVNNNQVGVLASVGATNYMFTSASGFVNAIGRSGDASSNYLDGYLTEVNFIDGQALTPSSFGSTNALTGVWQPARYTGTYGTNGFYLPFTDNSALTTSSNVGLGKDFSGNGNYWVTNNISITTGVTYDSMTDVPTLTSATAANFAVLNPVAPLTTGLTNGNLNMTGTATLYSSGRATIAIPAGTKIYWECAATAWAGGSSFQIGMVPTTYGGGNSGANYVGMQGAGNTFNMGSISSIGTFALNDVMGLAYDQAAGTLAIYKNNTLLGTISSVSTTLSFLPRLDCYTTTESGWINFGQRPFSFSPPSGYVALNAYNLP